MNFLDFFKSVATPPKPAPRVVHVLSLTRKEHRFTILEIDEFEGRRGRCVLKVVREGVSPYLLDVTNRRVFLHKLNKFIVNSDTKTVKDIECIGIRYEDYRGIHFEWTLKQL